MGHGVGGRWKMTGVCTGEGVVSSPEKGAASAEECEVLR